jgi:hypothetical protein
MKGLGILVLAIALVSMAACSSVVTYPTPPQPTVESGVPPSGAQATATTAPAAATSAPAPTLAPTVVVTGTVLPSGDLTESQMAVILADSFSAYPWQLDFSNVNAATSTTITGTLLTESPTRVEATLNEPVESMPAMVDVIVISPTLYVKVAGVPDLILEAVGLKANEWGEISAGEDTLGLASLALSVASPAELLAGIGFEDLLSLATPPPMPFKLVGTEEVGGVMANVYENTAGTAGAVATLQVVVGVDDSRVYRIESQGPERTVTTTMTYLSSLNIQPPIP